MRAPRGVLTAAAGFLVAQCIKPGAKRLLEVTRAEVEPRIRAGYKTVKAGYLARRAER